MAEGMNMTVEAVITWEDDTTETIHADGFVSLFNQIGKRNIKRIDAYEINQKEIRQGRCAEYVSGVRDNQGAQDDRL